VDRIARGTDRSQVVSSSLFISVCKGGWLFVGEISGRSLAHAPTALQRASYSVHCPFGRRVLTMSTTDFDPSSTDLTKMAVANSGPSSYSISDDSVWDKHDDRHGTGISLWSLADEILESFPQTGEGCPSPLITTSESVMICLVRLNLKASTRMLILSLFPVSLFPVTLFRRTGFRVAWTRLHRICPVSQQTWLIRGFKTSYYTRSTSNH